LERVKRRTVGHLENVRTRFFFITQMLTSKVSSFFHP